MNDEIYMFNGIIIPAKVTEGAISIKETVSVTGDDKKPTLANPVSKGKAVAIVGTSGEYLLVEYADGSNGTIIGFVHDHPEYDIDPTEDYTKNQAITADMLRKCGVETTFTDIRPVPAKTGENIKAGNYVKHGADGQSFEKSASETKMIALSDQSTENKIIIGIK